MSLGKKVVWGAIWTIGASVGTRIVGVVGTLVLTYFLAPEVVGDVGVAVVLVLTANRLSSLGFGQYVVAHPDVDRAQVFHASAYNMIFALASAAAILLLRDPLAPLFSAPDMVQYVPGLVVSGLLARVHYIPARILSRDLRFRTLAAGQGGGELAYAGVAVALAALGWGGHAIVWGNIARQLLRAVLYLAAVHRHEWLTWSRLSRERSRALFSFGLPIAIGDITDFFSRKWDNLLMAGFFGTGTLGLYNLAYNLADIPASHIGEHIGDVLLPSYARLKEKRRADVLIRSTSLLALVVFPLAIGLAAVADTLVAVLFNAEWQGVAPYIVILSSLSVSRPVGWTITSFLTAARHPRAVMVLGVFRLIALFAAIGALAFAGPLWAAAGVGVAFIAHGLASVLVVHRLDGVPRLPMLAGMGSALLACAPMAGAALGVRELVARAGYAGTALSLVAEIAAGAIVYIPSALLLAPASSRELLTQLRKALQRPGREKKPL